MIESTSNLWVKPKTLAEVADRAADAGSFEEFGRLLRDWQHVISRRVHDRDELAESLHDEPRSLRNVFVQGDVADAYLAAYALWLADQAEIDRPIWCQNEDRTPDHPWFAGSDHAFLVSRTPAAFVSRNLFTIPENVFRSEYQEVR